MAAMLVSLFSRPTGCPVEDVDERGVTETSRYFVGVGVPDVDVGVSV